MCLKQLFRSEAVYESARWEYIYNYIIIIIYNEKKKKIFGAAVLFGVLGPYQCSVAEKGLTRTWNNKKKCKRCQHINYGLETKIPPFP